jgi:hypothetical protein
MNTVDEIRACTARLLPAAIEAPLPAMAMDSCVSPAALGTHRHAHQADHVA